MKQFYKLVLLVVLFLSASSQIFSQVTLIPKENVFVKAGVDAGNNFVADTLVRVRSSGTIDNMRKSYLKYDLSTVTQSFTKAILRIWPERAVNAASPAGSILDHVDFYTVFDDSWKESTLNWSNAPTTVVKLGAIDFARQSSSEPKKSYDLDITNYITTEYNGDRIVSICISDDNTANNTDIRFYSTRAKTKLPFQLILSTGTAVENDYSLPTQFKVQQNYPNPFNPTTLIKYELPKEGLVDISIYNLLGQRIANLYNGVKSAGFQSISWNGKDSNGFELSSGIYFARVSFERNVSTIKMMLVR